MQKRKQTPDGVANNLLFTLYYVTCLYIICAAKLARPRPAPFCFRSHHLFPVTFSFEKATTVTMLTLLRSNVFLFYYERALLLPTSRRQILQQITPFILFFHRNSSLLSIVLCLHFSIKSLKKLYHSTAGIVYYGNIFILYITLCTLLSRYARPANSKQIYQVRSGPFNE